jgi:transcriptional regulator with XRE-family HTH domain
VSYHLRTVLMIKGITHTSLAKDLGVSRSYISHVLRGDMPASTRVKAALAQAAGLAEHEVGDLLPRRNP